MSFDKETFFEEYKTNAKTATKKIAENLKAAEKLVNESVKIAEKYKVPFESNLVIGFLTDAYVPKSLETLLQDLSQLEDLPLIDGKDFTQNLVEKNPDDEDLEGDDDYESEDGRYGSAYVYKNEGFVDFFDAFVENMGVKFEALENVYPDENSLLSGWDSDDWSSSSMYC